MGKGLEMGTDNSSTVNRELLGVASIPQGLELPGMGIPWICCSLGSH